MIITSDKVLYDVDKGKAADISTLTLEGAVFVFVKRMPLSPEGFSSVTLMRNTEVCLVNAWCSRRFVDRYRKKY